MILGAGPSHKAFVYVCKCNDTKEIKKRDILENCHIKKAVHSTIAWNLACIAGVNWIGFYKLVGETLGTRLIGSDIYLDVLWVPEDFFTRVW